MTDITGLNKILYGLVEDISKNYKDHSKESFNNYFDSIQKNTTPYIQNGFLDKKKASKRFISETAVLHLATVLFEEWCLIHKIGIAKNYFKLHKEGKYFSWYSIEKKVKKEISEWVSTNLKIEDAAQIISLIAENTNTGLHKKPLGEFYTPTSIASHLYSLTRFKADKLITHKVVDPACGSGNLLRVLVANVVELVKKEKFNVKQALLALNDNVYGYDIQPVAILITKIQLLIVSLPILKKIKTDHLNLYELLPFENIQLSDPLKYSQKFWDTSSKFDLVMGNPPYLKVIKENLPYHKNFQEIFSGQPNLYQMFLWWAIKSTNDGGIITFLIPQSIRSGQYFKKLRNEISKYCDIKAITNFTSETGVFESVQQQMMIISLQKKKENSSSDVVIRKTYNGNESIKFKEIKLPQKKVVFQNNGETIWCISDAKIDYEILNKVYSKSSLLSKLEQLEISNGGFVWNQNKSSLQSKNIGEGNFIPLISAGSIGVHEFTFPPKDERLENRIFVKKTYGMTEPSYSQHSVLIKRTTPQKMQGRRIIACVVPKKFLEDYTSYFCENHVNLIMANNNSEKYINALSAWFNSRLANFIFGMMNGSSHISKYELELLPISENLLSELAGINIGEKEEYMNNVDKVIFKFYKINKAQATRIYKLIPSS